MTAQQLKEIYVSAASRSRCNPQRTEEGEWKRAFEYADQHDLESAMNLFFESAARSGKGVWMPKVDELRPMVETARRQRESRSSQSRCFVAWKCPECGSTCCGWFDPHDQVTRRCLAPPAGGARTHGEICGARLEVIVRESAA